MTRKILNHPFFIRLFNWEYWPFHVVYAPTYLYWLWLCARSRSFFFFNTANPTITNGGFLMESKKNIYDLIPREYYPHTLFFKAGTSNETIAMEVAKGQLRFPLIAKPDIGMQGKAVKKIDDISGLLEYSLQSRVDFLVQEFASYENEVGIFYYRYPNQPTGKVSGIVSKEFLSVTGDGVSSLEDLLLMNKRYVLQIPVLRKTYGAELQRILNDDEKLLLVPYGNHVRGAKFIDSSHLIDDKLNNTIDRICKQVPGFYYGRLDIRYQSWEDLKEGKNFSIIELNGAGSEPTHMYDPRHTIFFAWKEIIRHLNILGRISRINHRLLQQPYMNFTAGIQMLRANKQYLKLIDNSVDKELNQPAVMVTRDFAFPS